MSTKFVSGESQLTSDATRVEYRIVLA